MIWLLRLPLHILTERTRNQDEADDFNFFSCLAGATELPSSRPVSLTYQPSYLNIRIHPVRFSRYLYLKIRQPRLTENML